MIAPRLFSVTIPASSNIGLEAITPLTTIPGIIPTVIGTLVLAKPVVKTINKMVQAGENPVSIKNGLQNLENGIDLVCSFVGK